MTERWKQPGAAEAGPAFVVIARTLGTVVLLIGVLVISGVLKSPAAPGTYSKAEY